MTLSDNSEILSGRPVANGGARRTKIIATLGPATDSPEMIRQLILAGLNVARINMSHATPEQTRLTVERIRAASDELQKRVGILMDLQGPAIRTGELPTSLNLKPGERIPTYVKRGGNDAAGERCGRTFGAGARQPDRHRKEGGRSKTYGDENCRRHAQHRHISADSLPACAV